MVGQSDTLPEMKPFLLCAVLLTAGCGDQRPAAPTAAEQRQLDETDAMLNQLGANEEGPRASAPDPSNRSTK